VVSDEQVVLMRRKYREGRTREGAAAAAAMSVRARAEALVASEATPG
jgi:hypothetical protein